MKPIFLTKLYFSDKFSSHKIYEMRHDVMNYLKSVLSEDYHVIVLLFFTEEKDKEPTFEILNNTDISDINMEKMNNIFLECLESQKIIK